MAAPSINKSTAEALLIWFAIVGFWPAYLIGGLYVLGSVIGWAVFAIVALRIFVEGKYTINPVPVLVWVWVAAMLMMEVALLIGHSEWSLGIAKTIKSSIGWAKGWALMALFIALGATLKIDFRLLTRGVCITSMLAIPFFIIGVLMFAVGGPDVLFVSPLQAVGPGPEFFELRFFGLNPESGRPRWFFFTPWAPAAGLLSCLFVVICLQEEDAKWRIAGVAGCLLICLASQSRAGLAIMLLVLSFLLVYRRLGLARSLIALGVAIPIVGLLGYPLIEGILDFIQGVKDSRPDSTRVRSALAEIALQRWQLEAPVWGHGIVERGPKIVEHMPIGTHHSWYGLLFTKGFVGAVSLAVPLLLTLIYLILSAHESRQALAALGLVLVLLMYSFFENIEILVYLYWPALLYIGYALQPLNSHSRRSSGLAKVST